MRPSSDELLARLECARADSSLADYRKQQEHKQIQQTLADKLLSLLKTDRELLTLIEETRALAWLLTISVETSLFHLAHLQNFFTAIAEKIRIPYVDWVHLTMAEVGEGIATGRAPSRAEISDRKRGYVFKCEQGCPRFMVGQEALDRIEQLRAPALSRVQNILELQGQAAASGRARGRVRLVLRAQDSESLIPGEILVCSMTSPEYVPSMMRAGAIVTDEGGLLCHAAIVSRELGKPCIIGTKIATRLLRTGDEVEVDATRGLIRLLNRS